MHRQLTALAAELASLREHIGRNSCNSSQPPSSESKGFKTHIPRKGSGRKRGGQPGHPGTGPELLPVERCKESPMIICLKPVAAAEVIEHRLHHLLLSSLLHQHLR